VGDSPNAFPKLVVNDPTLVSPTVRQMSATDRSVVRSSAAAHLSPAHFSREFRRTFGETPHQYLLTRRLERAAAREGGHVERLAVARET